jgi:hypothetical protein
MKWVAAAAVVALAVLLYLLGEVTSESVPAAADARRPVASDAAAVVAVARPDAAVHDAGPDGEPGVFAVRSEAFWDRVDSYPRRLMSYVADCYKGGKDRKAKLKVSYQLSVESHQVTLKNVRILDSTMFDEELEGCMVRSLESLKFVDKEMPDFLSNHDDPEELLIRIEGLKRFLPEQENGMP